MHCLAEATEAALDIAAAPRDAVLDLLQRVPGSSVNDQKVLEQMVFMRSHTPIRSGGRSLSCILRRIPFLPSHLIQSGSLKIISTGKISGSFAKRKVKV